MITILRRRLDRIRLFRSYATFIEKKEFLSAMVALQNHAADWGMKKKLSKHCTTFSKSFGEGATTTSVAIKFFPVNVQSGIAVDFTPSKLTQEEWSHFRDILKTIFAKEVHQILSDFKLTRIEIAMDVEVPFDEMLCIAPRIATENLNYLKKGTRYLGQKGGMRTFCIYDKRKQLAEKAKVDLGHDLTRIEVRLRRSGKSLAEIATIQKPFGKFIAVRRAALSKICDKFPDDPVLQAFASSVVDGGSAQEAYLKFSKHYRKHLLKLLAPCSLRLNGKDEAWGAWISQQSSQVLSNFSGTEHQCN